MSKPAVSDRVRHLLPGLIGITFGSLWGVIAALALPRNYRPLATAITICIGLGCMVRLWTRRHSGGAGSVLFRSRAYLIAVAIEIAAINFANILLLRFGWQEYLYSAVGFIVGLHFIGLWKASGSRYFLTVSACMCLVSTLSVVVPFSWGMCHARHLFVGAGNAVILWVAATEGR